MAMDLIPILDRARAARAALVPAQKAGKYDGIDFRPPKGVREALRRGLELHEQGHSGDGLKPETVAWARRLASGEAISPEKARAMRAWLARHAVDRRPGWATEKTPGYVAWMLWGGDDAEGWSDKLVQQMEAADRDAKKGIDLGSLIDRSRRSLAELRQQQPETQKDAIVTGDLGPGVAPPHVGASERARFKPGVHEVKPVVVGQIAPPEEAVAQPAAKDSETTSLPDTSHLADVGQGSLRLVDFGGIPVVLDRPKGFVQRKLDDVGQLLWERTYQNDYGYLAGTEGGDGEGLDVFLGPEPTRADLPAWWAVQTREGGGFDEYKLMLGFADEAAARACYIAHIPEQYLASMTPMPVERVRALLGLPLLTLDATTKSAATRRTKLERCVKAISTLMAWSNGAMIDAPPGVPLPPTPHGGAWASVKGNTRAIEGAPENVRAIVATSPLTWTYPNPTAVSGWLGAIEPADESWIAFVAIDGHVLLWTEREPTGGAIGEPFLTWRHDLARRDVNLVASTKAASVEEQIIVGVVLVPERTDLQREIYDAEVVRKTAHNYLAFFRNTDLQHKIFINEAVELIESYLAPCDLWFGKDGTASAVAIDGARFVKKGSWILSHRVKDPTLWAEIRAGKYTGYSINGLSKKVPLQQAA